MKEILVLFALFAFAYASIYNVQVQLGSQLFEKVENATLNLVVISARGHHNGSISRYHFKVDRGDLIPSKNFTAELNIPFELNDITNLTFYWTRGDISQMERITASRHFTRSPKFSKKPVVYLDHVMITDTDETGRTTGRFGISRFIPTSQTQTIAHRQEIQLKLEYHAE